MKRIDKFNMLLPPLRDESVAGEQAKCVSCGRKRTVYPPPGVNLSDFDYVCCRCYGVGQMQAVLLRKK